MTTRQRKTWNRGKTADQSKTASPPPQMPAVDRTEPPDHPAYYPDPERDKYEKGDTSAWAEDPHDPMDPESPPPAMPGNLTTEPLTHPGTSEFSKHPESPEQAADAGGGGGKKATEKEASEQLTLKQQAERRASLAVRIASAMMPGAETAAVENKALELMDLEEPQLLATAATLKLVTGGDDEEEEVEEEEDVEVEASKKANHEVMARIDRLESSVGKLVEAMGSFFGNGEGDLSEDASPSPELVGPDSGSMTEKELLAFLMSAEDMDGDGVDQNDPRYGYSEKKGDDEEEMPHDEEPDKDKEFEEGEESEGTKEFDEEEGDKMASETDRMLQAMLAELGAEDGKSAGALEERDVEPLATGKGIQSGEGGNVDPDPAPETPEVSGPQTGGTAVKNADEQSPTENDIQLTAGVDPMDVLGEGADKQANDELLALYADIDLPKTAGDDQDEESDEDVDIGGGDTEEDMEEEEEDVEEETEKESGKKAASEVKTRPQPKKASTGAKTVGNVQGGMSKEAASEIHELEKLWDSAPDVSDYFGVPKP